MMHEYALPSTGTYQQRQQLQQEYANEYSQEYSPEYRHGDYGQEYPSEYQMPHVNGPPPLPRRSRMGGGGGGVTSQAIMAANPQMTPAVVPPYASCTTTLPIPASAPPFPAYSPSRFHVDKRCQSGCSWRCSSFGLIILCVLLTAMLAYFGAVGSMRSSTDQSTCITVQDEAGRSPSAGGPGQPAVGLADSPLAAAPAQTLPTEESLPTSTAVHYNGGLNFRTPQQGDSPTVNAASMMNTLGNHPGLNHPGLNQQQLQSQQENQLPSPAQQSPTWPAMLEMREFGIRHTTTIPPFQFWNSEFRNKQPAFIRLNFTLPWGANFAVYGRRNVAPSVTQHDFVEFIKAGRLDHRVRRSIADVAAFVSSHSYYDNREYDEDVLSRVSAVSFMAANATESRKDAGRVHQRSDDLPESERRKRSSELGGVPGMVLGSAGSSPVNSAIMKVNVSLVQYLDTGRWFLSVYNDDLRAQEVSLIVTEAEGVSTACPNDCSGHGSCYLGKCDCIDGYEGNDCSKSVCPVLCSNHGKYGGGMCHCEGGWKGAECDVPAGDCQVADCNGHGVCISGECRCEQGWAGATCDLQDCPDPLCSGHGTCVAGRCYCKAGWQGPACAVLDRQVYQCLPGCSEHGTYDLEAGACVCEPYWTGPDCSQALCGLDCGPNGVCDQGRCKCKTGWTGDRCNHLPCDPRCHEHGQCKNGTCVCSQGWNGRHCTLPGCRNGCSRHGTCMLEDGEYHCVCANGWAGRDCGISLETECTDNKDNDGDGMIDCSDSECCQHPNCSQHIMCMSSMNPVEVLLRKQPPLVTASFYQRVKFLIEENSVQSYAHTDLYTERRVSVMRGQVVTPQGLGIFGVRVSVEKDARLGFTLTRAGGWFDMLVNGGGAVTLQFLRNSFQSKARAVFVPWNQIVVLPPIVLPLVGEEPGGPTPTSAAAAASAAAEAAASAALGFEMPSVSLSLFSVNPDAPCFDHDHQLLKPVIVSTWMPDKIGGLPGRSIVFAENQVLQESIRIPGSDLYLQYQSSQAPGYLSTLLMRLTHDVIPTTLTHVHVTVQIEGSVHTKTYEADPNLTHTFAWNKRNVYKQKVYGVSQAKVSVGYKHSTCHRIIWETQTATLHGFDVDISDIGGWGLNIHHHYNFHEGILQKGDGSTLHLKRYPRTISVVAGSGIQRPVQCTNCNGQARDSQLLTPVALASGPDGSVYVGDFNLVRRITPEGKIYTVLQLTTTQVAYQYYLAVSPADGLLYISDPERHQILRVLTTGPSVSDPSTNSEPTVGSGERCVPGDETHCGDEGPAMAARLAHPKGIAIAADKTMYIADGTNIRAVDPLGIIHTLVGHHGHHNIWQPIPCHGAILASQAQLQWPTGLALSPLDGSLHFVDDRLVLKLSADRKVKVVAGTPLHCHGSGKDGLNPQNSKRDTSPSPSTPTMTRKLQDQDTEEGTEAISTPLGSILAISFSPTGELFIAESDARKINAIRVVDSAGIMFDFAGRPQQRNRFSRFSPACECSNMSATGWLSGCPCSSMADDPTDLKSSSKETLLSSNSQFSSISAMVVSPDGVLNVADQGTYHILALEHYLPAHDETSGGFRIPFPPTGEVYVFNRYGQHVETRDLTSGKTRYSFLYSKNNSFGKLSKVTDAAGNKISFLRDYSNVVNTIENTQDGKSEIKISNVGFLEKFSEVGRSEIELDYDSNTGLLTSRADSNGGGGKTFVYRYNELGRITDVVLPTGETLNLQSRLSLDDSVSVDITSPSTGILPLVVNEPGSKVAKRKIPPSSITMKVAGRGISRLAVIDGAEKSEALSFKNGSFTVLTPFGGRLECVARRRHPLLEMSLPIEAEMLPMWSEQVATTSVTGSNVMGWMYSLVGDAAPSKLTLHQDLWVNQSRVLGLEVQQASGKEIFYDRDGNTILTITFDNAGLPLSWAPANGWHPVNISYDKFNRVESWRWGNQIEKYTYDHHGLLAEIAFPHKGEVKTLKFSYNDSMLSRITLPSGRNFELRYDNDGGLRHITLPSGTQHLFSIQPSLGFLRATYTPPGSTRPYLQHYSYDGRLLQTVYPGDGARILYKYHPSGKLAEVLHGDGWSRFNYTRAPTVTHSEREIEYRWEYAHSGGLLVEERIEFGPKTGLSNAKMSYDYDENYRLVGLSGRIGGQNLPEYNLAYSPLTGALQQIGQFQVLRPQPNETHLSDGTAVFTRVTNDLLQEVQVAVTIHNVEAFRLEFTYDSRGRISGTRTFTRNVGINVYTNVKNYTWDVDGQLIGVKAQEPWSFEYDANGNMISLNYRENAIHMEYNPMDRVVKFGEGLYRYDNRGLVVQNAREERFKYNAKGLLIKASKRGRFTVNYYYDHLDRLATRKDNFGNITQFFYTNHERPHEVTHIYDPRNGKLISLMYDDRGHLIFAQVFRHKYYIATDQCGTPVMVFNQYGEGIREIMRSPYGHNVYDSNPYLYLPIDFCGGLLDPVTSLVHMPGGKVYDPLIGQLMGPAWEDIPSKLSKPTHFNLYRFNGNDPINLRKQKKHLTDHRSWLSAMGYDLASLAPQLYPKILPPRLLAPLRFHEAPSMVPSKATARLNDPPFTIISGFLSHMSERLMSDRVGVNVWPISSGDAEDVWPPNNPLFRFRIGAASEPPFGRGIVVSRTPQGLAVVNSVPSANPIYRDVFTSVFNGSYMLDVTFLIHGDQDSLYFVQPNTDRVTEDKGQLKRLGGSVNTTFHDHNKSTDKEKVVDLKIHTPNAVINLRYGTTPEKEKQRILHHAKSMALRRAWHREEEAIRNLFSGSVDWSATEQEEIQKLGSSSAYEGQFIHDITKYPELAEDPYNVRFVKKSGHELGSGTKIKRSVSNKNDASPVVGNWWRFRPAEHDPMC